MGQGAMLLFHQQGESPGKLAAILAENGFLTEFRTAAVCAVAASKMAPKRVQCIGIVGTGVQARFQLALLRDVIRYAGRQEENKIKKSKPI